MKKIFCILFVVFLCATIIAVPCFAAESDTPAEDTFTEENAGAATNTEDVILDTPAPDSPAPEEDTENAITSEEPSETLENPAQRDEEALLDQVIGLVTNGEIWAKIGASLLAVFALLATLKSSLAKITGIIEAIKALIAGKATKEETEAAIKSSTQDLKNTYESEFSKMSEKYDTLEAKYDQQTAVLSLLSLQLVKSPNARVQIMDLISKTKDIGGNVAGVVASIEAEIQAADAAEPKPDTPALDAVKAAVEASSKKIDPNEETTAYIALE